MALTDLTPVTRMESILNGDDIEPVTREEYFWQQAATNDNELPPVTSDDNGDVMTVVSGEWSHAAIPSQFNMVTITDNRGTISCDHTYLQIKDLYEENKPLLVVVSNVAGDHYVHRMFGIDAGSSVSFYNFREYANGVRIIRYKVSSTDEWSYSTADLTLTWS